MKKLILFLILCLVASLSLTAYAAQGDALLGKDGEDNLYFFNGCFTDGETLYLPMDGVMYTYRVGDAGLKQMLYQLPEYDGDQSVMAFITPEGLRCLLFRSTYKDEVTVFDGAELGALTPGEGDALVYEKLMDVDWTLINEYDEDTYPIRPDAPVAAGDVLFFHYYDDMGTDLLGRLNLETGEVDTVEDVQDILTFSAYKDGCLLLEQYTYESPEKVAFLVYDPADDSLQTLGQFEVEAYSPPVGVAYDGETDSFYCIKAGEICPLDIETGEIGEGITDMPIETYSGSNPPCMLKGGYYALCGDGAVVRNLDPGQKAEVRLKISDSTWSDVVNTAYYRYANANGDVSVVLSRDYNESTRLVEAMMNRDDSVDIYVLSGETAMYDALYNRGYMMELDGAEKVQALAEHMYPALREAVSTDGHVVALPVSTYCACLGVNERALAKLGLTMDDVPQDWSGFLDFLGGLPEKLTEDSKIHVFYPGETVASARNGLFSRMFEDYQNYVNHTDPAMGYNTPLLRELLGKLERLDFVALGCPESDEDAEDVVEVDTAYGDDSGSMTLLDNYVGCSIGNFYSDFTPLLLSLEPGEQPLMTLSISVAFVNPFTRHPENAMAYMDELADALSASTRYCLCPDENEPIRGTWYEQYMEEMRSDIANLTESLESAEPADRQMIEETLQEYQNNLQYYEENVWEISQKELDWYRAHDDNLAMATVNWLYADESGEGYELISRYQEGQITLDALLAGIDKKVQMMLLEGN